MIAYRVLEAIADLEAAVALEVAVWQLDPRDALPVNILRAIQHAGGLLNGAYDGQRLVGIALALPARSGDRWMLWSHLTGVDRAYQGQGIGLELKQQQRAWALASGFDEIRWTFDPLQRGNANFNLSLLSATGERYHVNFYGVMNDGINRAEIPSDRLEAVWRLRAEPHPVQINEDCPYLLRDNERPIFAPLEDAPQYLVQIPPALPADAALLLDWRLALRDALSGALACGYVAVNFTDSNAYLLCKNSACS